MEIPEQILQYCYYQERCHQEVRTKLSTMYYTDEMIEEIIVALIRNDVVNEERYAKAYARGKFRMLKWGKAKIKFELKKKQISDYCIKKGLFEIDDDEYFDVINKLVDKKWIETAKLRSINARKASVLRYMQQKGFESNIVLELIKNISENK